jgi:hypothetical protein
LAGEHEYTSASLVQLSVTATGPQICTDNRNILRTSIERIVDGWEVSFRHDPLFLINT